MRTDFEKLFKDFEQASRNAAAASSACEVLATAHVAFHLLEQHGETLVQLARKGLRYAD